MGPQIFLGKDETQAANYTIENLSDRSFPARSKESEISS